MAFLRGLDDETASIMLVPPLGGPERKLAQFYTRVVLGMWLASVAWTNDSKFLLVTGARTQGEPNHINRVSVETGEIVTMLTAEVNSNGYMSLAVAPDGRTLAAILVDASGSKPTKLIGLSDTWELQGERTLTSIASGIDSLEWTSDSKELVFRFAVNLPVPLYRVSVDGGEPTAMGWVGPDAFLPAISRDGRRLAFARFFRDTNIWRVTLDGPANSSPTIDRLAASSFREVYPQFSPDGKRLVFYSNRSGSIQIWTSEADGTRAVQLTNMDPLATTGSPRWSPDGQRVVFDSNADGGYHVYEISADGGQAKTLTSGTSSNFIGCYSPDGRWIYFSSDRSGRLEVWRMPSQGGTPEQVTRETGQAPTVSADNAWVYYTKKDGVGGLWRMPVNGGAESQVLDSVFRYNYALSPSGLYFVPPLKTDGSSSVRYLDFRTGSQREVVALDKPADLGLAVSPDGRFLLFTKLDYSGTDLMLVENFR